MPTGDDLVGLGMPPSLASILGNQPSSLTCTGTAQGTAATILSKLIELVAASSQTGAILPSGAHIGSPFYVFCSSSTSAVVYCPSGHTLNGTANNSLTLAQNKSAYLVQYKKGFWTSNLTA